MHVVEFFPKFSVCYLQSEKTFFTLIWKIPFLECFTFDPASVLYVFQPDQTLSIIS